MDKLIAIVTEKGYLLDEFSGGLGGEFVEGAMQRFVHRHIFEESIHGTRLFLFAIPPGEQVDLNDSFSRFDWWQDEDRT